MNSPMASRAMSNLYSPPLCGFICHRFFSLRPSSSSSLRWPSLGFCNPRSRFRANNFRFNGGRPPAVAVPNPQPRRVGHGGAGGVWSSQAVSGVELNGTVSSIKPQQVTYIVSGIEDFDQTDIPAFISKAQDLLDPTNAWAELSEQKRRVTTEELAEIIYGSREPLETYCAHLLLSKDEIYFNEIESKGSGIVYETRPVVQVEELSHWKRVKEESEKELQEFVQLLKSAKAMPLQSKPPKSSWMSEEKVEFWIKSLEAYALDTCKNEEKKKTAGNVTNLTLNL